MKRDIEAGDVVQYGKPPREARVVRVGERALIVRPGRSTGTMRIPREDIVAHISQRSFEN
jgi:hypothetical protein